VDTRTYNFAARRRPGRRAAAFDHSHLS
jgi:hypothetical protein